jgi:hypothetical protein
LGRTRGREESAYAIGERALASPIADTILRFLAVDAAHAEVFDLEEFLDAVFRAAVIRQLGR